MSGQDMGQLAVRAAGYDRHETLVCEVLDGGGRVAGWVMGEAGEHTLDLTPGLYAVRVTTSRGTSSVHPVALGTAGALLTLGAGSGAGSGAGGGARGGGRRPDDVAPPPPFIPAPPPFSPAPPPAIPAPPPSHASWAWDEAGEPPTTGALLAPEAPESPEAPNAPQPRPPTKPRAWRRVAVTLFLGEDPTKPLTQDLSDPGEDGGPSAVVDLEGFHAPGRFAVRVVGPAVAARIVHLPPSWGFGVQLRRGSADEDGVAVRVSGESATAAALMAQLSHGQLDAAGAVAEEMVQRARTLFQEKQASAEGAAAAGYFLIRAGRLAEIGDWPHRFAEIFPWLPDAHVVLAAAELERERPDLDLVRESVLAAAAWVPSYTEGLRLLHRQVELLRLTRPDEQIEEAAERVLALAAACDWRTVATTYWGTAPGRPTLDPPTQRELIDHDADDHLVVAVP